MEIKENFFIFRGMQLDITDCDLASKYNQQNYWTIDAIYQNLLSHYALLYLHILFNSLAALLPLKNHIVWQEVYVLKNCHI